MQTILQIYQNLFIQTLSNHLLQPHQPFKLLLKTSKMSWMFWLPKNILFMIKLFSKKIFMLPIILQNKSDFSNTFSNREVRYKNNFIISLSYIKYTFYSLIGLNYTMHPNITLHILLHPSSMHARSHQDPKPLYGTSPVDQQLSLNIHPWEISK